MNIRMRLGLAIALMAMLMPLLTTYDSRLTTSAAQDLPTDPVTRMRPF